MVAVLGHSRQQSRAISWVPLLALACTCLPRTMLHLETATGLFSRPADTQPAGDMEELFPGPTFELRHKLPQQAEPLVKPSILRTVSEIGSVGIQKYMNAGNFPTPGCEPTTELMRRVENMQYAKLLEQVTHSLSSTVAVTEGS